MGTGKLYPAPKSSCFKSSEGSTVNDQIRPVFWGVSGFDSTRFKSIFGPHQKEFSPASNRLIFNASFSIWRHCRIDRGRQAENRAQGPHPQWQFV